MWMAAFTFVLFSAALLAADFPIGFTKAPPPDGKTPSGADAYRELARNGAAFHRLGGKGVTEEEIDRALDRSAETGLRVALYLPEVTAPANAATEEQLRRLVNKYKNHPGLAYWKGDDEPEWGKVPVERVERFYRIVKELDPRHPIWLAQAPRGTVESLKRYDPYYDIGGMDIYPIGYPPGTHSVLPNKNISMVGDHADIVRAYTGGTKPFWMTLQIAWSGVIKPGKTLRFPTFPEERYMSYQSIIHGTRGLVYFGGNIPESLNDRDRPLGWNWTFYERVLKPVLDELNPSGPLYPALIAADSKLPVRVGGEGVEFCVREAAGQLFVIAAKREGATIQAKFTGLPGGIAGGAVLFEEPRKITAAGGAFTDWFGPNEVHVYRFERH
jgi:hypothetical protein